MFRVDMRETSSRAWWALRDGILSVISAFWSFLVALVLFLPRIIHDLVVRPDEEGNQSSRHLLTWEFGQAYKNLPSLMKSLAFKTRNLDEQLRESMLNGNLRKTFTEVRCFVTLRAIAQRCAFDSLVLTLLQFDLVMVGIGQVVGSGVFYKGGIVQATSTGSAVFLGYILDFVPIFLASIIYAEFTVEYPVAGGAFTWTMATLGEFPAVMTLGLVLVNYVLSIAAVARVLTGSIALLLNIYVENFLVDLGGTQLDFVSFALTILCTLLLCIGTRESGFLLAAANITGIFFILFVGIAGFTHANANVFKSDWMPYGPEGLFQSLPSLLFSYIGFDAIAYSIEEAKEKKDAPAAYMWTVGVSGVLYVFMALSLSFFISGVLLNQCTNSLSEIVSCSVPGAVKSYYQAFVFAFDRAGMPWMQYIFAIGSVICIATTLLVCLFVSARLIMVGAREWMLPPMLAKVSTRTKTPIAAQILVGSISAVLTLFTGYSKLSDLASFAYLCTMLVVCNDFVVRRYYPDVKLRVSQYGTVEAKAARFMSVTTSKDYDISTMLSGSTLSNPSTQAQTVLNETVRTMKLPTDTNVTRTANAHVPHRKDTSRVVGDSLDSLMRNSIDVSTGMDNKIETAADTMDTKASSHSNMSVTRSATINTDNNSEKNSKRSQSVNPVMWSVLKINMTKKMQRWTVWLFLIAINASSVCVGVLYRVYPDKLAAIWALVTWGVMTVLMALMCPVEYEPDTWKIHRYLLPFVPSVAILGIIFVASNLSGFDYIYSLVIAGAVALYYVFFSMPLSYIRKYSSSSEGDGTRVIELVYKHGNWISVDQMTARLPRYDERYSDEYPGINSLPGSIVDRTRTISRTLSRMNPGINSLAGISPTTSDIAGMLPGPSSRSLSPTMSGRFSSEMETLALSGSIGSIHSWGSAELYRKPTGKFSTHKPKLETITASTIGTSDSRRTCSAAEVSHSPTDSDRVVPNPTGRARRPDSRLSLSSREGVSGMHASDLSTEEENALDGVDGHEGDPEQHGLEDR